ncbi:DUF4251 domain-containing protein [Flexithrix dorotheae]|uniref:DUF4251 domain-containing protein n=1 Tax=Flexithrix dorotheae TaxID=70993 RepID=UPI00036A4793|nr:DUF4251 domain-containing protein [Flexithrix dorotheae]
MRKAIFIFIFCLIGSYGFGQETNKNLSKKEKKALKRQEALENKEALLLIVNKQRFVIEANTVFDRYGQSFIMNPTTNFVGVKDDVATIQLAFDAVVGLNGVGGVTLDGKISKYEVKEGKDTKPITINMRASGAAMGPVSLSITVQPDGNARAYISGDFGERISFQGRLVSLEKSGVYKGMSLH